MTNIKNKFHKILKETFINQKRNRSFINESMISGKTIINVDIQPEYADYVTFNLYEWINFLTENSDNNRIIFLYNGDSMGMTSESDYRYWLYELELDESIIDNAIFFDKGYAFFRYCMDAGINEDQIVNLVQYMIANDINDSRDFDKEMWNDFVNQYGNTDIRELMEISDDCINIPDLMDFLSNYNNIVLTGGGINECLKEVEIALMALDKPYQVLNQYTY